MDRNRNITHTLESGKVIGFRIDNWVLKETQRKTESKGIVELFTRIGVDDGNLDVIAFSVLFIEAYNEYQYFEKKEGRIKNEVLINDREASELIDEIGGIISALVVLTEGLQTYIPKNTSPLQTVGELTSQ